MSPYYTVFPTFNHDAKFLNIKRASKKPGDVFNYPVVMVLRISDLELQGN